MIPAVVVLVVLWAYVLPQPPSAESWPPARTDVALWLVMALVLGVAAAFPIQHVSGVGPDFATFYGVVFGAIVVIVIVAVSTRRGALSRERRNAATNDNAHVDE